MPYKKPVVVVTVGDPAGIGPEIALKALLHRRIYDVCKPLLIGHEQVIRRYWTQCNLEIPPLHVVHRVQDSEFIPGQIDLLDVSDDVNGTESIEFGKISAVAGSITLRDIECAVKLVMKGEVQAVVAGPHTKKSVEQAGVFFDGFPSLVARLTDTPLTNTFLMLVSGNLRIVNVTLHTSLREAIDAIKQDLVYQAIRAAADTVQKLVHHDVRVAVTGLNPHAGESGMFGREEIEEIGPAVQRAQEDGLNVTGPYPADSLFPDLLNGKFDVCVAMYHDQAHIPIKLAGPQLGSAFTIGTPVTFATVAHGSALQIAGQGIANPDGLVETILRVSGDGVALN
ncbi:4-hydroxythreonine-4-phosphate dehydrogenase PdxA [Alicyclobacillus fastidiosus]|uniref:4-hydroxythreonine-4-phosphate dehydrogenase PdxA n=1 Tax=Alicyclobacillus fastidiosus TaxID=392011 RepID=A0ABY6ZJU0_9BACL|nr:4-hydroxythreonine-4-phosphate dehydrogenase PdxA [Alicyclobacillus fastidiosus]WAH43111.1 4-hydroxythreonine-4-phosphate dehydrogenase PdxA [Alicyclobacillus fastidiosus]GMA65112.1 4-hydroxythreonine-4-phosphate dehydrogenase [Alicyclobacillus fastidiosus]